MRDEPSTSSSVRSVDGVGDRLRYWALLGGNRLAFAVGVVLAVFLVVRAAIAAGVAAVGPASLAGTAFASGLVSGTITLVTIALSINQLILSRVFGSPGELREELDGTRELRERVRSQIDAASTPNDPAAFLSTIAVALERHADRFGNAVAAGDRTPPDAVEGYAADIGAYGAAIDEHVEEESAIVDVLGTILGTEYAQNLTATQHVRAAHGDALPAAADEALDAIEALLESVAVTRQFFKTLSLQQDFARLSRFVAYAGLVALLASLLVALVYRTGSTTVPAAALPWVVSVGVAVVVSPLAVFIAYVVRAATIARRTVSVGPFVPPAERS